MNALPSERAPVPGGDDQRQRKRGPQEQCARTLTATYEAVAKVLDQCTPLVLATTSGVALITLGIWAGLEQPEVRVLVLGAAPWMDTNKVMPANAVFFLVTLVLAGQRIKRLEQALTQRGARCAELRAQLDARRTQQPEGADKGKRGRGRPRKSATGYSEAEVRRMASEIYQLRQQRMTWRQIGEEYGVDPRTAQKWVNDWHPTDDSELIA